MGEFLDQMLSGGPSLVALAQVLLCIPGLQEDLESGGDPGAAVEALAGLIERPLPSPHRAYGHLLFGVASMRAHAAAPRNNENDLRTVATVVGAVHGAPAFGSSMGDVPVSSIVEALTSAGFARTVDRWLAAYSDRLAAEQLRTQGARVWEIPDALFDSDAPWHRDACVGIHDGGYVAVDLAAYGERLCSPLVGVFWVNIPGVPRGYAFDREFRRGGKLTIEGEARLSAILTTYCGAPRELRMFGLQ